MNTIKTGLRSNSKSLFRIGLLVLFGGLCLYVFLRDGDSDDYGEKGSPPVTDSCELYRLIVKGNVSESDYDSIRHYLRKTVYKSRLLEKSIFFDHGHSDSPALYVHAKLNGERWESTVVCNDSNLDDIVVGHLLEVSSELIAMARKKYSFDEIYFYCSIL